MTSSATPVVVDNSSNYLLSDSSHESRQKAQKKKNEMNVDVEQTTGADGLDPPRDSGIDLAASFQDDGDEDILDLATFEELDDEESWLYAAPTTDRTNDILSWLRKDVDSLDANTRRSLATKLELILRNKNKLETNGEVVKNGDSSSKEDQPAPAVIGRRKTFNLSRSSEDEESASVHGQVLDQNKAQRKLTPPTLTISSAVDDEKIFLDERLLPIPGRRSLEEMLKDLTSKQTVINPDLKDIRLLASRQEQDLRQCLQQLQLSQTQRRRTTSDQQEASNGESTVKTPLVPQRIIQENVSFAKPSSVQKSKVLPASAGRFGTFTKKPRQTTYDVDDEQQHRVQNNSMQVVSTPKNPSKQQDVRPMSNLQNSSTSLLVAQKDSGLQKSLPNLAADAKTAEMLRREDAMTTSTSEKGSYADVSFENSQHINSNRPSTASSSRLPTPRSRLPTPAARPSSGSKIAMPTNRATTPSFKASSTQRTKPAMPTSMNDSWKEGCI